MQKRRRLDRTNISRRAKIVLGPAETRDCMVLNLNTAGACLEVSNPHAIPDEVDLTFDEARTLRACRIAWRLGRKVGVTFLSAK
jgi:hypothetical protein